MNKAANVVMTLSFSFLVVLYSAMMQAKPGESIVIHYDAPLWIALQCFIAQWLTLQVYFRLSPKPKMAALSASHHLKIFVLSNLMYTLSLTVLVLPMEYAFGFQAIDKAHISLLVITLSLLHALNGGAVIAVRLLKNLNQQQLALEKTQKRLLENKLKQLQQQLDPHFLFNNLNVLSALIVSNPEEADSFLDNFANIYRYVLDSQNQDTVSVAQEIAFATDYMALLEQRFDNAYRLKMEYDAQAFLQHKTLPCTLQLALENVIKHNQGDARHPLEIKIEVSEFWLVISNEVRPKPFMPPSSGLGLKNLKIRSQAVLGKPMQVDQSRDQFTLRVPIVSM